MLGSTQIILVNIARISSTRLVKHIYILLNSSSTLADLFLVYAFHCFLACEPHMTPRMADLRLLSCRSTALCLGGFRHAAGGRDDERRPRSAGEDPNLKVSKEKEPFLASSLLKIISQAQAQLICIFLSSSR